MSDFILAFMFLRIFFVLRSVFNYSIYTDAFSKKLCKSYGFTSGVRFTMKCHFAVHPGKTMFFLFLLSIMVFGYLVRIFELPYHRLSPIDSTFDGLFNAFWLVITTMTTVGYGDVFPHTVPGRIVAILAALVGAFLISLLVLAVSSVFDLNQN